MGNKSRIIGFDLARAYAIFGMYIVNFNMVFGSYNDTSPVGKFLSLFSGNSSTIFVMLAGMGIALMTNRPHYTHEEKKKLRHTVLKRALFLFVLGLLLSIWWPADILHFYGLYLFIATFLLFLPTRYYLIASILSILVFHVLLLIIPFEKGWNFDTLEYTDLWSIPGFIRNTFYNGWNSVFPWIAYFTTGMYLGRLHWTLLITKKRVFLLGAALFIPVTILQICAQNIFTNKELIEIITADYLPPLLPFLLSTIGFGLMLIAGFMYSSSFFLENKFIQNLATTGQMTLTHYIAHLTIGMIIFSLLSGKPYGAKINQTASVHPLWILTFSIVYFIFSYYFSKIWKTKYKNGPLETLMRKISS